MSVTQENFEVKVNEVTHNLYRAYFYFRNHEKMIEEGNTHTKEHPPSFYLLRDASYEAGVLRLTKAYDKDKDSLSIFKMISIFESNYKHWNLSTNIDAEKLKEDKKYVLPETNQLVKALIHLRDKAISHTDNKLHPKPPLDMKSVYGGEEIIFQDGRLTTEEIESLPEDEKQQRLSQITFDTFEIIEKYETELLGEEIPSFEQICELTIKGFEICNRYRQLVGLLPEELKLEGFD